jgi:DNA-binding IscR family transcriptional regulator
VDKTVVLIFCTLGNSNQTTVIPLEEIAQKASLKGSNVKALYTNLEAHAEIIITTKRGQKGQGSKGIK